MPSRPWAARTPPRSGYRATYLLPPPGAFAGRRAPHEPQARTPARCKCAENSAKRLVSAPALAAAVSGRCRQLPVPPRAIAVPSGDPAWQITYAAQGGFAVPCYRTPAATAANPPTKTHRCGCASPFRPRLKSIAGEGPHTRPAASSREHARGLGPPWAARRERGDAARRACLPGEGGHLQTRLRCTTRPSPRRQIANARGARPSSIPLPPRTLVLSVRTPATHERRVRAYAAPRRARCSNIPHRAAYLVSRAGGGIRQIARERRHRGFRTRGEAYGVPGRGEVMRPTRACTHEQEPSPFSGDGVLLYCPRAGPLWLSTRIRGARKGKPGPVHRAERVPPASMQRPTSRAAKLGGEWPSRVAMVDRGAPRSGGSAAVEAKARTRMARALGPGPAPTSYTYCEEACC
ncbi:hypothetical protein OBBRIDRAFT_832260 [Obba rivulosa]|uniref:Uncharacterized protein n=1 Tax=Obba rivulosa TaxID=1052685 RepID=A0A8E2DQH9_9APHY|nr:hypothetical protein OBBRIDRAFT_832260 [Obba rivulosa]